MKDREKTKKQLIEELAELRQRVGELEKTGPEGKQVEEQLRESEERYRTLFEAESNAIFLVDEDSGEIVDANPAAVRLYGYSREELSRMKAGR